MEFSLFKSGLFRLFLLLILLTSIVLGITIISKTVNDDVFHRDLQLPSTLRDLEALKQNISRREETRKRTEIIPDKVYGPGEYGEKFIVKLEDLDPSEQLKFKAGYEEHRFNEYASDLISLHRKLSPSMIDPRCRSLQYPSNLPNVSVVIPFRDEAWSTLLRTVHSILERSDQKLIKEIILVDDNSSLPHLKDKLDVYLRSLPNVTLLRTNKSSGLMMARQAGIDKARSEVIVTMDSHIEVGEGWLEPLIYPIYKDRKVMTFPGLEAISKDDFHFSASKLEAPIIVPNFDFSLGMCFSKLQPEYLNARRNLTESILSPTIQGWMFAMNREHFSDLGGFDPGMDVWGGEQMELSFKVWMCGGRIEMVPCCHAGHLYRSNKWKNIRDIYFRNNYRVAEVWMDQYSTMLKERTAHIVKAGDVSARKAIRERMQCKSFDWYLDEIVKFVDMYIPRNRKAKGTIRNAELQKCIQASTTEWTPRLVQCKDGFHFYWDMSANDEMRHKDHCLTTQNSKKIVTEKCNERNTNPSHKWIYTDGNLIEHSATGKCLTGYKKGTNSMALELVECKKESPNQIWEFTRLS